MAKHEPDIHGWCIFCSAPPVDGANHCAVATAFDSWLLSSVTYGLKVKDVMNSTEITIAKQAFAAGYRSRP